MTMDVYGQMATKIIQAQEVIIGPVAVEQAKRIPNLRIDWDKKDVNIKGSGEAAINDLVAVYERLFGKISQEVSKEAAAPFINKLPVDSLPQSLK